MYSERLTVDGPAGRIEGMLTGPAGGPVAVLCHPHPLYGGSMHDGVLDTLARALAQQDVAALRFNFRGVGGSEGRHDGDGEVDDLRAVLTWLAKSHPGTPRWLGGYSFGAAIATRLLADADAETLQRVLLVAPPVGRLPTRPPDGRVPVDVFAGDADPFVDVEALSAWSGARVHLIRGADHFFSGNLDTLEAAVSATLAA